MKREDIDKKILLPSKFISLFLFLFLFFSLNFISFTSATFGNNEIPQGFKTINQNFFNVTGSNINASSIDCSPDFLNSYDNFTGLFTCTGVGGLTWSDIINGTIYLSNNTYTFWNSTFADFNKTYADTLYATASQIANFYLNTTNQFSYYNATSLTTNSQLLNGFSFYNSTSSSEDKPVNLTNCARLFK